MHDLVYIENELTSLLNRDKKNWTRFYLLIKEVEEQELWKEKYRSFTQWVKEFSVKTKTHESIIWNRKKAGQVYMTYVERQQGKGIKVVPIQEATVSADSLVLLDKIKKYNPNKCAELTERVMNNGISKKELREVYKSIRPMLNKISNNPHIKVVEDNERESSITALDIVTALCQYEWLGVPMERQYFKSSFIRNKYRTFTEFPVYTGTTKYSRRIDVLICENLRAANPWEVNLHGVEIKISKQDLLHDQKYTEYVEFVDYMWLAVPEELVEEAKNNKFLDCGVISVIKNEEKIEVKIIQEARRLDAIRRKETLENLILRTL